MPSTIVTMAVYCGLPLNPHSVMRLPGPLAWRFAYFPILMLNWIMLTRRLIFLRKCSKESYVCISKIHLSNEKERDQGCGDAATRHTPSVVCAPASSVSTLNVRREPGEL